MERKYLSNIDDNGNQLPDEEFVEQVVEMLGYDRELMDMVYMSDDGTKLVVLDLEDKYVSS